MWSVGQLQCEVRCLWSGWKCEHMEFWSSGAGSCGAPDWMRVLHEEYCGLRRDYRMESGSQHFVDECGRLDLGEGHSGLVGSGRLYDFACELLST